tara:strand:- start:323 stop:556 length:234 start_codon:yes stop_codon:yes gene_type:complete
MSRGQTDPNFPEIRKSPQRSTKKEIKRFAPEKNQFLTGPTENEFELSQADKYMYTEGSRLKRRIKKKVQELKQEGNK